MEKKGFFVAATGQDVGKTTTCLGLVSGLKKRLNRVAFMKPVGQQHRETTTGLSVDKDVILFREHFSLTDDYTQMSPVLFPKGFTRDYLDGKINRSHLCDTILNSYQKICASNCVTVVEGTGHIGVGSIIDLNNAQVAHLLGLDVILVAPGGLGSSFDELTLNKMQCDHYGVKIAGVILNKVLDNKRDMVTDYMARALEKWNIPLLGAIPYNPFLSTPSMKDFEQLFSTPLLAGQEEQFRHFQDICLVASSVEVFRKTIRPNQLLITPSNREDIILATLTRYWDAKISNPNKKIETGFILTGETPPSASIIKQLQHAHIPVLFTPTSSYNAMKMIHSYTAKIRNDDVEKILAAIREVETHIDFDRLCDLL